MSAPPQSIAPNPYTNLLNVYIQIANKMGFQPPPPKVPVSVIVSRMYPFLSTQIFGISLVLVIINGTILNPGQESSWG
jgi:hypothetical protein